MCFAIVIVLNRVKHRRLDKGIDFYSSVPFVAPAGHGLRFIFLISMSTYVKSGTYELLSKKISIKIDGVLASSPKVKPMTEW